MKRGREQGAASGGGISGGPGAQKEAGGSSGGPGAYAGAPTCSHALDLDIVEGVLTEDVAGVADLGDALRGEEGEGSVRGRERCGHEGAPSNNAEQLYSPPGP